MIERLQQDMKRLGFYTGEIDGKWGPQSEKAYRSLVGLTDETKIAWGSKVSPFFRSRVIDISARLGVDPDHLMNCMAFESAETFRSDIKNAAGSGAVGLIQFMPSTAKGLGTSTDQLALMTPESQLNYVEKYFKPYSGKLKNLGDVYMAILWPAGVGKSDDWVLWNQQGLPTTYRQNAGLDVNKDAVITRGEAIKKVMEKAARGEQYRW
jgi:hypothetical protein